MEPLAELWQQIYESWPEIKEIIFARLPVATCMMVNNEGQFVESNRPMSESIVCDKVERSPRLFFYMCEAGIMQPPEAVALIEQTATGRIIHIHGYSTVGLTVGGQEQVSRAGDR